MGSFIAQELTLANSEKVDKLILYASLCGGNESQPASPEVDKPSAILQCLHKSKCSLLILKELVSLDVMGKQANAAVNWARTGSCNAIPNIIQPALIIVGSDDLLTQAANSLILAQRIFESWLVQIGDAAMD
jgi:pimeloyl-ACP methyl ester carboxylesterase